LYAGLNTTDDLYKTKPSAAGTPALKNKKPDLFIYMMGFFAKLENCWLCPASSFPEKHLAHTMPLALLSFLLPPYSGCPHPVILHRQLNIYP